MCCNDDQIEELITNFNLIDYIFGYPGGGCDVCSNNIKRFWCYYTCSPKQQEFVVPYSLIDVVQDGTKYHVRNISMFIDPQLAVEIYESCNKVQKITLNTPMQSAAGLLQFLGSNSVKQGKSLINVEFEDPKNKNIKPLFMKGEACNSTFSKVDNFGFPISHNCTCNNCKSMCDNSFQFSSSHSAMEGFDYWLVLGVYVGIILATLGINFMRGYMKKDRQRSRSLSLNSSHLLKDQDDLIKIIKNPKALG